VQGFGFTTVNDNLVNVPRVNHIDDDLFTVLEAKVDLKACPIKSHIPIGYVVATMEDNFG
jgi:hypothetical protein